MTDDSESQTQLWKEAADKDILSEDDSETQLPKDQPLLQGRTEDKDRIFEEERMLPVEAMMLDSDSDKDDSDSDKDGKWKPTNKYKNEANPKGKS